MNIFENTSCCALFHMRVTEQESIEILRKNLLKYKKEERNSTQARTNCYTIVTPSEKKLAQDLTTLGFKEVAKFRGKRTYGKRMLRMFMIDFADVQGAEARQTIVRSEPRRLNGMLDMRFNVNK